MHHLFNDTNSYPMPINPQTSITISQLFSYFDDADYNYKKVLFLDDTNQISDWTGEHLKYCTLTITRYNGAVANIYMYGLQSFIAPFPVIGYFCI